MEVYSEPNPAEEAPHTWESSWRPRSPKRLSDLTHALAARALSGEHGRGMAPATFSLDESSVAGLSPSMRYAHAAKLVAEQAPLRILPGERIVGATTLLEATWHQMPVAGGSSTSHTTIGFARALEIGYAGLRRQIDERLARGDLDAAGVDQLGAMRLCLDAAGIWHQRYLDRLQELANAATGAERESYLQVCRNLARVPEEPPQTFAEAVQALWFLYAFQRLMGNWSGIGRIDQMLWPYLQRDLAAGRLTLDEARELLAHFWIKGCEWIGAKNGHLGGSGDAQFYQNIVLAGVDADGQDGTNPVTYLVLDVVEELHISDFPIAVRINSQTLEKLLRRVAMVQRHGGGIVALYNEEVVIDALVQFGYPLREARGFSNDGCWEVIIPGKTAFIYSPFDMLALLQETLGLKTPEQAAPEFADFEALYAAFLERLGAHLDAFHRNTDHFAADPNFPSPLLSLLVEDCIERGRDYHNRGSHYAVCAPHAGGMANAANSLLVIADLVYRKKELSLAEFIRLLRADWEGAESLRRRILKEYAFYGNDSDAADAMMARLFNDYTALAARVRERNGVLRPAGISTFGREIEWADPDRPGGGRSASPDGHHAGEVLATNFSPSPGTDKKGPTAVLRSYCKMDFTRVPNGATVELKMHPGSVGGDRGLDALVALMRAFVRLGGFFLHIDVVDSEMLRDAQRHPEQYANLSVRVSGWSARFATLNKQWQDMIIARTQQTL